MSVFWVTGFRDLNMFLLNRAVWVLLALWSSFCAVLFFSYLDVFLDLQPTLQAKDFRYGVTDLVIIPYLRMMGLIAIIVIVSLASRLFYWECFSVFAVWHRSLQPSALGLVFAKACVVAFLVFVVLFLVALPVCVTGVLFAYDLDRVLGLLVALFVLLLSIGLVAMVLSQCVSYAVVLVLVVMSWLVVSEVLSRLLTSPVWLQPVVAYFSPVSHLDRMATGVFALSDVCFFCGLVAMLLVVAVRQFDCRFFVNS